MTTPITVARWTHWSSSTDNAGAKVSCGGSGGWVAGHVWAEYLEDHGTEEHPYLEALRAEIVRLGIKRGGDWHQREGVPVFSDGTVGHFSMRAWGDLCAAIWNTHNRVGHIEPRDYGYMDFYMASRALDDVEGGE